MSRAKRAGVLQLFRSAHVSLQPSNSNLLPDPVDFFASDSPEPPDSDSPDSSRSMESLPLHSNQSESTDEIAPLSSDSDSDEINFQTKSDKPLLEQLNNWFVTTRPHSLKSYTKLLRVLRNFHPELPTTASTALQSLKKCVYESMDNYEGLPGRYAYYGLVVRLHSIYKSSPQFRDFVVQQETLNLILSTDGVLIYRCSSTRINMWPLSFKIVSDVYSVPPITFGLFEGPSKPGQEFLIDLSKEMSAISNCFIEFGNFRIKIVIVGFTCDAPARAFCKNIKGCNAGQGCERCDCQARKHNHVQCFADFKNCNARCDEEFRRLLYIEHQKGVPVLLRIQSVDFILDFFLDVMHLCDEGVTKRFLTKLFGKVKNKHASKIQMSMHQMAQMEKARQEMKAFVSKDFQRPLVAVKFFSEWKACTFRDFTLYVGPVILKPFLSNELYSFFLKYCTALRILRSRSACKKPELVALAQSLLNDFVTDYDRMIGFKDTVYCIHSLIHLPSDVERTGLPLDELSAYAFENSYRYLRDHVQSSSVAIAQIEKRQHEHDPHFKVHKIFHEVPVVTKKTDGSIKTFRYLYFELDFYSQNDSYASLHDGSIVKTVKVSSITNCNYVIEAQLYHKVKPFFLDPIDSSSLGIFVVKGTNKCISFSHEKLKHKIYMLPYKEHFIAFPAVHSM